jgi:hypothetical protein
VKRLQYALVAVPDTSSQEEPQQAQQRLPDPVESSKNGNKPDHTRARSKDVATSHRLLRIDGKRLDVQDLAAPRALMVSLNVLGENVRASKVAAG